MGLLASAAMVLGASQMASAADLPMKAAPYVAPVWSWTGFYIGANVGAGWGTTEQTVTGASIINREQLVTSSDALSNFIGSNSTISGLSIPLSQNSRSGFLGGGQVGWNYQSGWVVFGIQGDIVGMDVKGKDPCVLLFSCNAKSDWLATVSGRIGGVVADRTLLYVKGGGAWMDTKYSIGLPSFGGSGLPIGIGSPSSTSTGWLLGMGVEYMFAQNWTGFIEYNYMEFDKKNIAYPISFNGSPIAVVNADALNKLSVAKVGINYKFY
jgi:outer membrane immunogenic protein